MNINKKMFNWRQSTKWIPTGANSDFPLPGFQNVLSIDESGHQILKKGTLSYTRLSILIIHVKGLALESLGGFTSAWVEVCTKTSPHAWTWEASFWYVLCASHHTPSWNLKDAGFTRDPRSALRKET